MPRNALLVEITDDDLAYATKKNQYRCAIVRAIQRRYPEAIYVTADKDTIRLTMPTDDGGKGTRYIFETPAEVREKVIRAFDEGREIDPDWRTFTISHAIEAKPMQHESRSDRLERLKKQRHDAPRTRSNNPRVSHFNRFITSVHEFELAEPHGDDAS